MISGAESSGSAPILHTRGASVGNPVELPNNNVHIELPSTRSAKKFLVSRIEEEANFQPSGFNSQASRNTATYKTTPILPHPALGPQNTPTTVHSGEFNQESDQSEPGRVRDFSGVDKSRQNVWHQSQSKINRPVNGKTSHSESSHTSQQLPRLLRKGKDRLCNPDQSPRDQYNNDRAKRNNGLPPSERYLFTIPLLTDPKALGDDDNDDDETSALNVGEKFYDNNSRKWN
jgi:hypothetical protein